MVSPPQVKYYPCAIHKGEDDLESLAEIVASRSSMSKADCYGGLGYENQQEVIVQSVCIAPSVESIFTGGRLWRPTKNINSNSLLLVNLVYL